MTQRFEITREIGIDAGHRVPDHGSKCRNLHGHRYTIQATCVGDLIDDGEQTGMVLDFGFLKDEMMNIIDKECDHATILYQYDPLLKDHMDAFGKLVLVDFIPTAENLAKYWYNSLDAQVRIRSNFKATLMKVRVYETPNCWAEYPSLSHHASCGC